METVKDYYTIFFVVLLGFSITVLICLLIIKIVKKLMYKYKKNAERKARKKMRMLRNREAIKKNQNINSVL